MKKALLLGLALIITSLVVLTLINPGFTARVSADNSECQAKMASEIDQYLKARKISLKGGNAEFYSNDHEQLYLLSSEETVNPWAKKSFKSTFAVINFKNADGKNTFYTLEQEVTPTQITYSVKQDSRVLKTIPMKIAANLIPGTGNQPPIIPKKCKDLQDSANALLAALAAEANASCERRGACIETCIPPTDPNAIVFTIVDIEPTALKCRIYNEGSLSYDLIRSRDWLKISDATLVHQALDFAIKKQGTMYKLFN